jgi:hypothetical protein
MSKHKFTVGSLIGVPQARVALKTLRAPIAVMPARPKTRCCRLMCSGCPWAEAQRARAAQNAVPQQK